MVTADMLMKECEELNQGKVAWIFFYKFINLLLQQANEDESDVIQMYTKGS